MPIVRTLNQDFFKTWTPEMAYVLGFFAADGSMLKNSRGAHFVEFTIIDRVVLESIKRAVGSNHKIASREPGGACKTTYRLQIGSKEWFKDLTTLGFTQNKSNTMKYPQIPSHMLGHFVRGYFDGDGCAYFKKHWSASHHKMVWIFTTRFTSGSREFLKQMHTSLKEKGVMRGSISAKSTNAFDLLFSRRDSLALYRLMYHTTGVSDLFLPRKREKLEQAIQVLQLDK